MSQKVHKLLRQAGKSLNIKTLYLKKSFNRTNRIERGKHLGKIKKIILDNK